MRPNFRFAVFSAALAAASLTPAAALACGGFFCNRAQPVNQAAESIIFADNGDGTTTAVIQIRYQGPSKSFSWLLPISSVPKADSDVGIASNLALQRLQSATNPNYTLTTRIEGTCRQDLRQVPGVSTGGTSSSAPMSAAGGANGGGGVTVEASGVVGAFDWTVISLDASLTSPEDAAVNWLTTNGYDVPSGAGSLLGPYLQDGMYLLAVKLTKGADAGSIRPIVLTYKGTEASIPIKLTAVAANNDMGVLTWMLGSSRAVPKNYLSLELNEARINWFNAASTYNSVVIDAANDAGGQGFVTEFAGATSALATTVWSPGDQQTWLNFKGRVYSGFSEFFQAANGQYGSFDGFWDATRAAVTLPDKVTFEDFKLCPNCYADQIQFSPATYVAELEKSVIAPMKLVQNLIDTHPELTRLYTTLSAEEMTLDPIFTFNADLKDVSNVHTAVRVIECQPDLYQFEAPWRIELPQGGVVRGTAANAQTGTWPNDLNALPPNSRIVRAGATGSGKVVEDNSADILDQLSTHNAGVPAPTPSPGAGGADPGGASSGAAGPAPSSGRNGSGGSGGSGGANAAAAKTEASGGCNLAVPNTPWWSVAALAFSAAALRRRRARR